MGAHHIAPPWRRSSKPSVSPAETLTWFLVDARSEGFNVIRTEPKMGQRACPAALLEFDGVFVSEEHVVGREGEGVVGREG